MASSFCVQLILWGLMALSSYFYWQRYQKRYYCFILKYSPEFLWQLIYNDEKPVNFKVLKSTVITSFLIVLHVKIAKSTRYFLVPADSTADESFRKLHVFLKINAQEKNS